MSPEHLDYFHTGHVGVPVSEIDHMGERDPFLVLGDGFVHQFVVPCAEYAFIDFEQELGLRSIVHCHPGPLGFPVFAVDERPGEDVLELGGYAASLYYLLQA